MRTRNWSDILDKHKTFIHKIFKFIHHNLSNKNGLCLETPEFDNENGYIISAHLVYSFYLHKDTFYNVFDKFFFEQAIAEDIEYTRGECLHTYKNKDDSDDLVTMCICFDFLKRYTEDRSLPKRVLPLVEEGFASEYEASIARVSKRSKKLERKSLQRVYTCSNPACNYTTFHKVGGDLLCDDCLLQLLLNKVAALEDKLEKVVNKQ